MGFHKLKIFFLLVYLFSYGTVAFAAMTCSVTTSCSSPGVVVFRMSSTGNAHAELPSESNYPQLVCCTGVTGLANSCSGTYGVVLRLSGTTNAHVEENTQSTGAYNGNNACLSVSAGTVTIGYQNNNCTGFDTTVASLSQTPTNAHAGSAGDYARKVCATVSASGGGFCSNFSCGGGSGLGFNPNDPKSVEQIKKAKEEILKIADFNKDGEVDILDLSILLFYLDERDSPGTYDLNSDGKVNFVDVSILFYYWTVF